MKKAFISILVLLTVSFAASAQSLSNDLGTWISAQAIKNIDKAFVTARVEHRSFDNIGATECAFFMAGAGYRFAPWLSGDLSYEYWTIPSVGDGMTVHKAVASLTASHKSGDLSVAFRAKYELAFNAAGGDPSHTFRWRLRTQYAPEGWSLRPYAMAELFTGVNNPAWIRSLYYVGAEIPLGGGHMLDLFYMYHLYPKNAGNPLNSQSVNIGSCHLLGAGYFFVF